MLKILILNVGSSSVKFKLYDESKAESHGGVYNIGIDGSYLTGDFRAMVVSFYDVSIS